jgi:hypothetical protein
VFLPWRGTSEKSLIVKKADAAEFFKLSRKRIGQAIVPIKRSRVWQVSSPSAHWGFFGLNFHLFERWVLLDFDVRDVLVLFREVPHHPGILFELLHGEGAVVLVILDDEAGSGELETQLMDGSGYRKPLFKNHFDQHFSSLG